MPEDHVEELLRCLPARPMIATRVLDTVDDPDVSISLIASVVSMDPALATRLIRVANTAAGARRNGIVSAEKAVLLLGASTVRAVVSVGAFSLLSSDVDLGPDGFWPHALAVAAGARVAAPSVGAAADEAFTAGLLHDIGTVAMHYADPQGWASLNDSGSVVNRLERERTMFGLDHTELGGRAAIRWGLPDPLVSAIDSHHRQPLPAGALAQAVMLGEAIAAVTSDEAEPEPSHPLSTLVRDLRLTVKPDWLVRETERRYERLARLADAGTEHGTRD